MKTYVLYYYVCLFDFVKTARLNNGEIQQPGEKYIIYRATGTRHYVLHVLEYFTKILKAMTLHVYQSIIKKKNDTERSSLILSIRIT